MAQIKNIDLYFPIQLGVLKEGLAVPFGIFLFLPLNMRLVPYRIRNELIEEGFLDLCASRKITQFFISQEDRDAYLKYIEVHKEALNTAAAETAVDTLEETAAKPDAEQPFEKEESAPALPPEIELKKEQSEKIQESIKELMSEKPEERKKAIDAMAAVAQEIALEGESKQSLFSDAWQSSTDENFDGHSKNIATFSVIFALGMGFNSRDTVKQLSLAALLHDIGMSQMDVETARLPSETRNKEQKTRFEEHMRYSLEMLAAMNLGLPPTTLKILAQHHEKFDGTGYPKKLKNWDVDSLSQIMSMADIFDSMIRGRFDGKERTLAEAFKDLVHIEKSKIFPQYYNPDLFNKLVKWVETQSDTVILEQADQIVQETLDSTVKVPSAA